MQSNAQKTLRRLSFLSVAILITFTYTSLTCPLLASLRNTHACLRMPAQHSCVPGLACATLLCARASLRNTCPWVRLTAQHFSLRATCAGLARNSLRLARLRDTLRAPSAPLAQMCAHLAHSQHTTCTQPTHNLVTVQPQKLS